MVACLDQNNNILYQHKGETETDVNVHYVGLQVSPQSRFQCQLANRYKI